MSRENVPVLYASRERLLEPGSRLSADSKAAEGAFGEVRKTVKKILLCRRARRQEAG